MAIHDFSKSDFWTWWDGKTDCMWKTSHLKEEENAFSSTHFEIIAAAKSITWPADKDGIYFIHTTCVTDYSH